MNLSRREAVANYSQAAAIIPEARLTAGWPDEASIRAVRCEV